MNDLSDCNNISEAHYFISKYPLYIGDPKWITKHVPIVGKQNMLRLFESLYDDIHKAVADLLYEEHLLDIFRDLNSEDHIISTDHKDIPITSISFSQFLNSLDTKLSDEMYDMIYLGQAKYELNKFRQQIIDTDE